MATRAEEERLRQEQGERFLKQLTDMFAQTRLDMEQKFIPRPELNARLEHMDEIVERVTNAVEKLAGNVDAFQQNTPRIYAEKADMKAELAELRTEIEKLKTARETDMQRGYGYRIEDIQGRYKGDIGVERGWRTSEQQQQQQQQQRQQQVLTWVISGSIALLTIFSSAIMTLALRGH